MHRSIAIAAIAVKGMEDGIFVDTLEELIDRSEPTAQEREIQAKLTSDNGGFFGMSDVSPLASLGIVGGFFVVLAGIAMRLLASGYKLRH